MGSSRWDSSSWTSYSKTTATKSTAQLFTNRSIHEDLDPKNIAVRESRDSDENPNSTAIIVASDVTASMGVLATTLIKTGLGVLFEEIYDRKPVPDPHIMAMAVGDAYCDNAPLQVTQFEADISIADQLANVYVEQGGGGNGYESYDMPMYYAAHHTSIDCFEKRGKKGYLFTIGDEPAPPCTTARSVNEFITEDSGMQADIPMKDVVEAAEKMYEVYHIVVMEGHHARHDLQGVKNSWVPLLGERVIMLEDASKLAEVIVSIIEVNEGKSVADVTASWSGDTALVVNAAVSGMTAAKADASTTGVTRL